MNENIRGYVRIACTGRPQVKDPTTAVLPAVEQDDDEIVWGRGGDIPPAAVVADQHVPFGVEEVVARAEGAVVEGVMKTTGKSEPLEFVEKRDG